MMKLIVDGPDGVGKTTLIKQIADHFGCDVIHMTEKGSKLFEDYEAKSTLNNIVSDRSFLSELVYSSTFCRASQISRFDCEKLIQIYKERGWNILILTASKECLLNRLNLRGDEDEHKINNIDRLRVLYQGVGHYYDIPVVDVENTTAEEIIKNLEEGKYEFYYSK